MEREISLPRKCLLSKVASKIARTTFVGTSIKVKDAVFFSAVQKRWSVALFGRSF